MPYVIGIDLGTTNCCISVFENGTLKTIPNDLGSSVTPFVVAFTEAGRVVGEEAKTKADPNVVSNILRLLGRRFNDPVVQAFVKHGPFTVVSSSTGRPQIRVTIDEKTWFFFPEEVIAMVFTKLKQHAEAHLKGEVEGIVVTVPITTSYTYEAVTTTAHFGFRYRQSIFDAAQIAGVKLMGVIQSSVAIATSYRFENNAPTRSSLAVYDFGGGKLNVSILTFDENEAKVVGTDSDAQLGGEDVNSVLYTHFAAEFRRRHGQIFPKSGRKHLMAEVERVKRELSSTTEATVETGPLDNGINFIATITRQFYEGLCSCLFNKSIDVVHKVVDEAMIDKDQFNDVIPVGGSTRIPMIQQLLSEAFGDKTLSNITHPDEAAARGAAIQAALLADDQSENLRLLRVPNVVCKTLGFIDANDEAIPLINRGMPLPSKVSITTSNAATKTGSNKDHIDAIFKIFEGEGKVKNEVHLLGKMKVGGICRSLSTDFNVTFEVNVRGILTVTVGHAATEKVNAITIPNDDWRFSKEELEEMGHKAEELAREEEAFRYRLCVMKKLEDRITERMNAVEENRRKRKLAEEEDKKNNAQSKRARAWLENHQTAKIDALEQQLRKLDD